MSPRLRTTPTLPLPRAEAVEAAVTAVEVAVVTTVEEEVVVGFWHLKTAVC